MKEASSKKSSKSKSKKSSSSSADPKALAKDIASLKERIIKTRREGVDIEGAEYFKKHAEAWASGKKPTDVVKLSKGHLGRIEAVAWASANPDLVMTAGNDGRLLIWHGPTGNKLQMFKLKSNWIQTCAFRTFGGDSGIVASAGMDNICTLWTVKDNSKPYAELVQHEKFISCCRFLDDQRILTASTDATCLIWDVKNKSVTGTIHLSNEATTISVNKNGESLLVGLSDGVVELCDPKTEKSVSAFDCHDESVSSIAWFPNGTGFATASDDLSCHLFDVRSTDNILYAYELNDKLKTGIADLNDIVFSISGRFLFAAYEDMIRVWDTTSGAVVYELPQPAKTSSLDLNNDGTALCSGCHDNDGRIWTYV